MSDLHDQLDRIQFLLRAQGATMGALTHLLVKKDLINAEDFKATQRWYIEKMDQISIITAQLRFTEESNGDTEKLKSSLTELMKELENKTLCQS